MSLGYAELAYYHVSNKRKRSNIVLLKIATKYQEFFLLTLFVKSTDVHLVFNFEQTREVTIFFFINNTLLCLYMQGLCSFKNAFT